MSSLRKAPEHSTANRVLGSQTPSCTELGCGCIHVSCRPQPEPLKLPGNDIRESTKASLKCAPMDPRKKVLTCAERRGGASIALIGACFLRKEHRGSALRFTAICKLADLVARSRSLRFGRCESKLQRLSGILHAKGRRGSQPCDTRLRPGCNYHYFKHGP
jgi:hypothetical protein